MSHPSLCSYHSQNLCSVCSTITQDNQLQISHKESHLISRLHLVPTKLLPTQSGPLLGFRDKMKLQVGGSYNDPIIGFLDPKKLEISQPIERCPLHNPNLNALIPDIKKVIVEAKLTPYSIQRRIGELKGIICFHSPTTNQSYIRFILRSKEALDRLKKIAPYYLKAETISANIQPIPHALLEGDEEIEIKGKTILHRFNEFSLLLSPKGFVQTNTSVVQMLYNTASLWLEDYQLETICDVFSGHGPFLFHLEKNAKHCFGVEINESAVAIANESSRIFNRQTQFIATSSSSLKAYLNELRPDLVVVNPPRAGLASFSTLLLDLRPRLILYSSCNPETLAIDLERLQPIYKLNKIQIFDMFPHTHHFEVLLLLELASI